MNVRRGGLGRGLGALIPTGPTEEEELGARFEELPLDAIEPNPRQPREVFDADALAELVASIRAVGVLQPVVVRETGPGRYQLIMGERRWRASREAGMPVIPAIIRETADDALLRDALLENLHRQQLNPLEEAAAYQQLLTEFGTTHEQLADRIGRSRSHVSNTLRLLNLAPAVQRRVAAGVLSAGHARALLSLADQRSQERMAERIVAEGLSVRSVEELVTVGEPASRPRAIRTRTEQPGELTALAELLGEVLETRVAIEMGRKRGKLVIEFATRDDLQRVLGQIAPGILDEPAAPAPPENDGGSGYGDGGEQQVDGEQVAGEVPTGSDEGWDGHVHDGHDEHGHDEHGHDEHGHDEHGHDGHAHGDQGHGGHGGHGHDEHGHDEHGHDEHGHDEHGHDEHGHDEHGHDEHGGEHQHEQYEHHDGGQ